MESMTAGGMGGDEQKQWSYLKEVLIAWIWSVTEMFPKT